MNYLTKIVHGNLLEDNFSSLSMAWEISPNKPELIIENDNYIELVHGDEPTYLLLDTPEGDYVFDIGFNHEPIIMSDIAGIIVMFDKDNYVELQSYDDSSNSNYEQIKVMKKDNRYLFYAKRKGENTWQYIGGSTLIDATKIGFFIKGTPSVENKNLELKSLNVYRNNLIAFDNIPYGHVLEIYDSNSNLVNALRQASNERVFINTMTLDVPLNNCVIKLKDATNNIVFSETKQRIDGGDIYIRETNFSFFVNGSEISTDNILDLGSITNNVTEIDIKLRNNLDITERNKKIIISGVSNYFKGDEILFLSKTDVDNNAIEYKKEILIDEIGPSEMIDLKLKIDRENYESNIFYQNDFKAKIVIE